MRRSFIACVLALLGASEAGCLVAPSVYHSSEKGVLGARGGEIRSARVTSSAWELAVRSSGADDLVFLDSSVVLAGLVSLSGGDVGAPEAGSFVAIESRTGKKLWSIGRSGAPEASGIVAVRPSLWLRESSEGSVSLRRIDPTSGESLGKVTLPGGSVTLAPSGVVAIVSGVVGGTLHVAAVSLDDGKLVWKHEAKLELLEQPATRITLLGERVVVRSPTMVRALDTGSGKTVWETVAPLKGSREIPLESQGILLVRNEFVGTPAKLGLISENGALRWVSEDLGPLRVRSVVVVETGLLVVGERAKTDDQSGAVDELVCLDSSTGRKLWSRELKKRVGSVPVVVQGQLLVTLHSMRAEFGFKSDASADRLEVLDAATGSDRWGLDLPGLSQSTTQIPSVTRLGERTRWLPDRILSDGRRVLVIRPTAVASLDLGRKAFSDTSVIRGSLLGARGRFQQDDPLRVASLIAASSGIRKAEMNLLRGAGEQMTSMVRATNGSGSTAQVNLQAQMMTVSILLDAHALKVARVRAAKDAATTRIAWRDRASLGLLSQGAHAGYVVRPIAWFGGQGLMVQQPSSGRWFELLTGPPEHLFQDALLGPSPVAISPDGSMLVTLGVPADPASWEEDASFRFVSTIHRSVLGFKLRSESFRSAKDYPTRSMVPEESEIESGDQAFGLY